ncbi:MAG: S8 family serine peptidase, partial [Pyrinomonadaceae bacterium]
MRSNTLPRYFVMVLIFFGTLSMPYFVEAEEQYKPGEILVKFKSGVSEAEINATIQSYGASIKEHNEAINVYRLNIPNGSSVPEMVDLFDKDPRCEYAEPRHYDCRRARPTPGSERGLASMRAEPHNEHLVINTHWEVGHE